MRRDVFVEAPSAPVIHALTAPAGFLEPTDADVCFTASGAARCDLFVAGQQFPFVDDGCVSDDGRGLFPFTQASDVVLVCFSALGLVSSQHAVVAIGPRINLFTLYKSVLEAAGDVELRWDTFGMASAS